MNCARKAISASLKAGVLVAVLALGGCGQTFYCWKKIEPDPADTAETKRQVLEHNNFGRELGCFK